MLGLLGNKIALTLIAALVALTVLFGIIFHIANKLADAKLAEQERRIEQENQEARDDARKARNVVSDCYRTGGVWSQSDGACLP